MVPDIDELTSPVEAGLTWVIGQAPPCELGISPGAPVVRDHLENGVTRMRVGLRPDGRGTGHAAGTQIVAADGTRAGDVTSGGFAPTLGVPDRHGLRAPRPGGGRAQKLFLMVRGKPLPATVVPMPFVAHRYHR